VSLYLRMCFLLPFISYLILSILERIFEPVDSLYNAPCSRHLDKTFSSQANSEFIHNGALELLPVFFLLPHFTVYTEGCCSPSLLLSNPVTESFVPSLPQIDPIAQVLLFCTNITRNHFTIGVKSSHCFQSHILHGDHAISERALSRSERLVSGLKVG
jgi:hypothetical protein